MKMRTCPECGEKKLVKIKKNLTRKFGSKSIKIKDVEFFECEKCKSKFFDSAAMDYMEAELHLKEKKSA